MCSGAHQAIENLCLRKDKHTLQRLAGEWLVDFKGQCWEPDFELADYLKRSTHRHEARAISGNFTTPTE